MIAKHKKLRWLTDTELSLDSTIQPGPTDRMQNIRPEFPRCRFCGRSVRALRNNGIIGPGYAEWDYVCNSCGKVQ